MSEKVTKESVDYRPAIDPQKRCGTCSMFRPVDGDNPGHVTTGTCTLVKGIIQAPMVCDRWDPR